MEIPSQVYVVLAVLVVALVARVAMSRRVPSVDTESYKLGSLSTLLGLSVTKGNPDLDLVTGSPEVTWAYLLGGRIRKAQAEAKGEALGRPLAFRFLQDHLSWWFGPTVNPTFRDVYECTLEIENTNVKNRFEAWLETDKDFLNPDTAGAAPEIARGTGKFGTWILCGSDPGLAQRLGPALDAAANSLHTFHVRANVGSLALHYQRLALVAAIPQMETHRDVLLELSKALDS